VAAATDICVRAVNGEKIEQQQIQDLQSVFSRGGFTQGYYNAKLGKEMFGYRKYEDVLATTGVLKGYEVLYKNERPRIKVDFEFILNKGKKTSLLAQDNCGYIAFVEGSIPEKAITKGIDAQIATEKLSKTGGTPFFIGEIKTKIDDDLSIPVSEINNLRRQAFNIIIEKRAIPRRIEFNSSIIDNIKTNTSVVTQNALKLHVSMRYFYQITSAILKVADIIFLPIQELLSHFDEAENLIKNGLNLGVVLPRAVFVETVVSLQKNLEILKDLGVKDALCGNIGTFKMAQDAGFKVHGDFGLNILNCYSFEEALNLGAISCVLSFEAMLTQIKSITEKNGSFAGVIVYGRLPLMLTRNCPVKNGIGCKKDKSKSAFCEIKDQNGEILPVICDGQTCDILNTRPLWMCDKKSDIKKSGVSFASFIFTIELPQEIDSIIEAWQEEQPTQQSFTRGLYYRGIE
jgi:putative protease